MRPVSMLPVCDAGVAFPTVKELFGSALAPAPWLPSRPVVELALKVLPHVTDDLAARLIIQMATTIADLREELTAVREVEAAALALLHQQRVENLRLRTRLVEFRTRRRAA